MAAYFSLPACLLRGSHTGNLTKPLLSTFKVIPRHSNFFVKAQPTSLQRTQTLSFSTIRNIEKSFLDSKTFIQTRLRRGVQILSQRNVAKYKRRTALAVDGNVQKDTLIYSYNFDKYYGRITYFSIIIPFILITQSIFTKMDAAKLGKRDLKVPAEKRSRWQRFQSWILRNQWDILSITYTVAGIGMVIICHFYVTRTVTKIWLLKGGEKLKIQHYWYFATKREMVVPLEDTNFKMSRSVEGINVSFKVKDRRMLYMIDKKDGTFHEPNIFDFVICFARVLEGSEKDSFWKRFWRF